MTATEQEIQKILGRPYSWQVTPEEDGRFSARIVEFPGCFSDGESMAEAFSNLRDAAESWVEAALKNGIAIPEPAPTVEASGRFALRMPRTLHARLQQLAQSEDTSLNQYIVSVLSESIGRSDVSKTIRRVLDGFVLIPSSVLSESGATQEVRSNVIPYSSSVATNGTNSYLQ